FWIPAFAPLSRGRAVWLLALIPVRYVSLRSFPRTRESIRSAGSPLTGHPVALARRGPLRGRADCFTGSHRPSGLRMLDAAIKAISQMFSPAFRIVLLKAAGLALALIVIVAAGLHRLLAWLVAAGGLMLETSIGPNAH